MVCTFLRVYYSSRYGANNHKAIEPSFTLESTVLMWFGLLLQIGAQFGWNRSHCFCLVLDPIWFGLVYKLLRHELSLDLIKLEVF